MSKWGVYLLLAFIMTMLPLSCTEKNESFRQNIKNPSFKYTVLKGLEKSSAITRRDPSDVIFYENKYYVWYTKTEHGPSGYYATIWYADSKDSYDWNEKGEALTKGNEGEWDEYSVFTPNILVTNNKFYLFFTAVKSTPNRDDLYFENNSVNDFTAIGIATADSPDEAFVRIDHNPILTVSHESTSFDSYRVDDACVIVREGKYWLYYKGRSIVHGVSGPRNTKMGVAFATKPEGPYIKFDGNPITQGGHEVMVWPYRNGVMTLLSSVGKQGKTIQFAEDGLKFNFISKVNDNYPRAPGYFRADGFNENNQIDLKNFWGISMNHGDDKHFPFLIRYELED